MTDRHKTLLADVMEVQLIRNLRAMALVGSFQVLSIGCSRAMMPDATERDVVSAEIIEAVEIRDLLNTRDIGYLGSRSRLRYWPFEEQFKKTRSDAIPVAIVIVASDRVGTKAAGWKLTADRDMRIALGKMERNMGKDIYVLSVVENHCKDTCARVDIRIDASDFSLSKHRIE